MLDPDRLAGSKRFDAAVHFVGRLVGEGQRQDLAGRNAVPQQVGDAVRDDAGLAAAGPGQDQQRPVDVLDGLALGGGQVVETADLPRRAAFLRLSRGRSLTKR